jgi:hypothetical protein
VARRAGSCSSGTCGRMSSGWRIPG